MQAKLSFGDPNQTGDIFSIPKQQLAEYIISAQAAPPGAAALECPFGSRCTAAGEPQLQRP